VYRGRTQGLCLCLLLRVESTGLNLLSFLVQRQIEIRVNSYVAFSRSYLFIIVWSFVARSLVPSVYFRADTQIGKELSMIII